MAYSIEFKNEALRLSDEVGTTKASEILGVNKKTLARWRRNRNDVSTHSKSTRKNFSMTIEKIDKNIADLMLVKRILSKVGKSINSIH